MYQLLRKNWRNPFLLNLLLSLHPSLLALCFAFISFFNTLLLRIIVNKNIVTKKMVLLIASFYFNRIFSGTRTTSFRKKCKIRKLNWLHVIRLYILVNVNEIQMSKKKTASGIWQTGRVRGFDENGTVASHFHPIFFLQRTFWFMK